MKLMFISDIHGSLGFLNEVLESMKIEAPDKLVILGDILYHGPRNPLPQAYNPKEVALVLNSYKDSVIAVRGNCDSEVDQMVIDFPIMSDYLTMFDGKRQIFMTHGHLYNDDNMPKLSDGDVFINGHTHIPRAEKINGIFKLNPGSISMPKEETPRCYGILSENGFTIKILEGVVFNEILFDK